MRAGDKHAHLPVKTVNDVLLQGIELGLIDLAALALHGRLCDDGHGLGGLLPAHHRRFGVGPGETKAWFKAASAHAVIARTKRGAAVNRDLRHRGIGHGLNHLGAVLDDARLFIGAPYHEAGGVVEVNDGRLALATGLYEVRGFGGTSRVYGPVVGDDAHRKAFNFDVAAHRGAAVVFTKRQKIRIIGQTGNHFAHIYRALGVHGHDAQQLFGTIARRLVTAQGLGRQVAVPVYLR